MFFYRKYLIYNLPAFGETVDGFPPLCIKCQNFRNALNLRSEIDHLLLSARFIHGKKVMLDALQKKNWTAFAKAYNGTAYAPNRYDLKLANAYKKFKS